MRLIDADALLETMKATDRYFMVKFDIESAPTVDQWHYPSKGELPKKDTLCVVILEQLSDDKKRFTLISRYFEEYGWADFAPSYYNVVAWMSLPDLPKEEA